MKVRGREAGFLEQLGFVDIPQRCLQTYQTCTGSDQDHQERSGPSHTFRTQKSLLGWLVIGT